MQRLESEHTIALRGLMKSFKWCAMFAATVLFATNVPRLSKTAALFASSSSNWFKNSPEDEVFQIVTNAGGRVLSTSEIETIQKGKSFSYRPQYDLPELYLFAPSEGVNVVNLTEFSSFREEQEYDIHIFALHMKDAPITERAIGLCAIDGPQWTNVRLQNTSDWIRTKKVEIDGNWDKLSKVQRQKIASIQASNQTLLKTLDNLPVIVIYKNHGYAMKSWTTAKEIQPLAHNIGRE